MKKARILLIISIFMLLASLVGCKSDDLPEVFTNFSEKEISFLSQKSQYITVEVTIVDNEKEMNFKTSLEVDENVATKIKIEEITDAAFFSEKAKITDVKVSNQTRIPSTRDMITVFFFIIVLMFVVAILVYGIREYLKVKKNKI